MKLRILALALFGIAAFAASPRTEACTRVLYTGEGAAEPAQTLRIVGRTLDWSAPIPTNIYVYPRGMRKKSNDKGKIVTWTSKYGAVYAVGYDAGVTEGMNEKGLVINGLFCRGTIYNTQKIEDDPELPVISLAVFPAWLLDNCATTQEVIDMVKDQHFKITGATFDGGTVSTLHWGVTDSTGHSAILEFQEGKLNIYQEEGDYSVLTNDPPFPAMNAINDYWENVGGQNFLPGTVKSPDRFARGSFFIKHVDHPNDLPTALSIIRTIMEDVSVPYKYALGDKNLSSTQWRSFSNILDKTYYFQMVTNLGLYYVDLKECDLSEGASVMKFDTAKADLAIGNITSQMEAVPPFTPMY